MMATVNIENCSYTAVTRWVTIEVNYNLISSITDLFY